MHRTAKPASSGHRDAQEQVFAYGLIADALANVPCASLLATMRSPQTARLFAAHRIPFSIDALPGADGAKLFSWICEYDELLNGRGNLVLPFESVYCHGGLSGPWGRRAEDVRSFAEYWQLAPRPAGLRLDHISVELNVVADLTALEARLAAQGDAAEALRVRAACSAFLRDHLAHWIGALATDVAARARIFVYRDLMQLAVELVRADADAALENAFASTQRHAH